MNVWTICSGNSARFTPTRLAHANAWLEEAYYQPRPVITLLTEKMAMPRPAVTGLLQQNGRYWLTLAWHSDQALMGVVAVKHFFVRRFALAEKWSSLMKCIVMTISQVHWLIAFVGITGIRCTVIILSATLLPNVRNKLLEVEDNDTTATDYPLITGKTPLVKSFRNVFFA